MSARTAAKLPFNPVEAAADKIAIYGLGLGLHETLQFLHGQGHEFDDFQDWILARNGGTIEPARIARVNERIRRLGEGASSSAPAGTAIEPALDAEDLAFWDEHGYVVLREAVPREAALAAEQAVWGFVGARPEDPDTWYGNSDGHTIMVPLIHHPAFDANRRSPRIHAAYAQLLGTDDLVVTVDRGGFNPPERANWRFPGPYLHWDTSLAVPIPLTIQGILYLADTPADQGAFCCVAGFHRRIESWLGGLPPGVDPRREILKHPATAVAGRAGDMVLWSDSLPHGASPNRGLYPRIVQYIAMYPADKVDRRPWI
ncbi:MAG TPA: phytanoyl-CoA dioxygenase family protein [Reyranella sp.]|nr:phytanoyl-CoA dioxygenase family protein [Reyranella sp.]